MQEINFTKMHGAGNDFVVIDCIHQVIGNRQELAKKMLIRRFGVGADQLILICPSVKADYLMEIYNPDGSQVEMCGNALRAIALYIRQRLKNGASSYRIETASGIAIAEIVGDEVKVNMGQPQFLAEAIGLTENRQFKEETYQFSKELSRKITCVSMGNPHCVIFVDKVKNYPVELEGKLIENHSLFKNRTNVEFVHVLSKNEVEMRVWERGAGETLACGSGACAVAVATIITGRTEREMVIHLLGGKLRIFWNSSDNCVYMTGDATFVYDGVWRNS